MSSFIAEAVLQMHEDLGRFAHCRVLVLVLRTEYVLEPHLKSEVPRHQGL